nr:MAG TPA: hypothetical protein [Bacteriophage sp.]
MSTLKIRPLNSKDYFIIIKRKPLLLTAMALEPV